MKTPEEVLAEIWGIDVDDLYNANALNNTMVKQIILAITTYHNQFKLDDENKT